MGNLINNFKSKLGLATSSFINLRKAGFSVETLIEFGADLWEIFVCKLDNFVYWTLHFMPSYCPSHEAESGLQLIQYRGPLHKSFWRSFLFLMFFYRSFYDFFDVAQDIFQSGMVTDDPFKAAFQGMALALPSFSYFFGMQSYLKHEEMVLTYNRFMYLHQELEVRGGYYQKRYWRQQQFLMAIVVTGLVSTLGIVEFAYVWILICRPGNVISPFSSYFQHDNYGVPALSLEVVLGVYALKYGYAIVMETVTLGGFAALGAGGIIKALREECKHCSTMSDWESAISIHETFHLLTKNFNDLINPIFLPGIFPLLTFTLVILNYMAIRVLLRPDMMQEFGILAFLIVAAISLLATIGLLIALWMVAKATRSSKEILRKAKTEVSAMRGDLRLLRQGKRAQAHLLLKRIIGIQYIQVMNGVDGPVTEVAGLRFLQNITSYTCTLLLLF